MSYPENKIMLQKEELQKLLIVQNSGYGFIETTSIHNLTVQGNFHR